LIPHTWWIQHQASKSLISVSRIILSQYELRNVVTFWHLQASLHFLVATKREVHIYISQRETTMKAFGTDRTLTRVLVSRVVQILAGSLSSSHIPQATIPVAVLAINFTAFSCICSNRAADGTTNSRLTSIACSSSSLKYKSASVALPALRKWSVALAVVKSFSVCSALEYHPSCRLPSSLTAAQHILFKDPALC
jgi:hypothetical protein